MKLKQPPGSRGQAKTYPQERWASYVQDLLRGPVLHSVKDGELTLLDGMTVPLPYAPLALSHIRAQADRDVGVEQVQR